MRFSRSLCGAGLAAFGAAAFFGFDLEDLRGAAFDGLGADFLAAFLTGFLAAFRGLSPAIAQI